MAPEYHTTPDDERPSIPILLPSGFDARDHLPPWLHRHADRASILVHRLRSYSIREGDHRWLPMSREDMARHFGHHRTWMEVRQAFVDAGVWTSDWFAIREEKAYWYRLLDPWTRRDLARHDIEDGAVVRRLEQDERERREHEGWMPVHRHLESVLRGVRIDRDAAAGHLATLDEERRTEAEDQIASFDLGNPRCVRDRFGRFHTPVSRLRKSLRPFLRFRGLSFRSLDISSCQPFLLGLLCLPSFRIPLEPSELEEKWKGTLLSEFSLHTPGRQLSEVDAGLAEYLTLCSEGRYYAEFAEMRGMPYGTKEERQAVKHANCVMLYGRRGPSRAFARRWRVVADAIRSLKEPGYLNAAATLQRLESAFMIERVCAELMRDHPDIPVLTIHDGVLVPPDAEPLVRDAIHRHVGRFGFPVHIKE